MTTHKVTLKKQCVWLLGILLCFQISRCYAQTQISGHVFSAKDSTAIYGGSVYFNGTSIGVSTNDDGAFKISFEKNNSSLIISAMGFESVIIPAESIQTSRTLAPIYLLEKTEDLETVYLETDPWSRSKKLNIFKREFLGKDKAAGLCHILNEDAIKLRYTPSTKTLLATANAPLLIENKYLGYMLTYNLRDFEVKFKMSNNAADVPVVISYHGFSFYKAMATKIKRKISKNRKQSYLGSSLHFMRSLYSKTLTENNFKILYRWVESPPYQYFQITDLNQMKHVKVLVDKIVIRYKSYKQSILFAKSDFIIDYTGYHSPPEAINLNGEMSAKRISERLPLGFKP